MKNNKLYTINKWNKNLFDGGGFAGAGAGGSWDTETLQNVEGKDFNEAWDNAVKAGLKEFIFQGRRYNTKKENNPVREYNNRWVGASRRADVKNPSKAYDIQAGPIGGPLSLVPLVTDTYIGSPNRPPQLEYNPEAYDVYHHLNGMTTMSEKPRRIIPGKSKDKNGNLFAYAGQMDNWASLANADKSNNPWNYADDVDVTKQYMNSTGNNWFGLSKKDNPFSKGNMAGGLGTMAKTGIGKGVLGAAGQAVAPGIGGLISGGYDAGGVGNAIGSVGSSIGSAVGAVNPVAGAVVSLASQAVGGLVNRSFGTKVDQAKLNAVNEANSYYNNFVSKADSFDDVKGIQAQGNFSNPYKNGWLTSAADKKNAALKRRFDEGKAFAENSQINNIYNIANDQIADDLGNITAFGGPLSSYDSNMGAIEYGLLLDERNRRAKKDQNNNDSIGSLFSMPSNAYALGGDVQMNGADFTTGLTSVNAGGSHEENPYDGVQMGVDPEGTPNLVEEGEVIYNDYVYSNRIELDEEAKSKFKFPKKRDITYADAAKKLEKEVSERPNDPISQAAFKAQMESLAEQQERQKQEMEAQKAQEAFEALSPEEQVELMQYAQQQEQAEQEAAMQEQAMAEQQAAAQQQVSPEEQAMMQQPQPAQQEMMGEQPVMAYGGNLFVTGGDKNEYKLVDDDLRKVFGDTAFAKFMENAGQIIEDPISYFAGDEIEAIATKLSTMSKPSIDRFFKTSAGQAVARAIVWADENLTSNRNVREAGVRPSKAIVKAGSRLAKSVVDSAKRSIKASQLASKSKAGNGISAMSRGQNPAVAQGIARAKAEKAVKAAEDAGFKLVKAGEKAKATQTVKGFEKVKPKGGVGVGSYTKTSNLNSSRLHNTTASKEAFNTDYSKIPKIPLDHSKVVNGPVIKAATVAATTPLVYGLAAHGYNKYRGWLDSMFADTDENANAQEVASNVPSNSSSKDVKWGTSASGLHTRTVNGRTQYRGADGKYYYSEQQALNTRKPKAAQGPTAQQAAVAQQEAQRTEEAKKVVANSTVGGNRDSAASNTGGTAAPAASRTAQSVAQAPTSNVDGMNVGTYRGEGNQWDVYGKPGLVHYVSNALADYDLADTPEAKQEIAKRIVDQLNGIQQSYYDYIVPTLGQQKQNKNTKVGEHQRKYQDLTNNAGFIGVDPITGQKMDLTDQAVIMPEGHNTTDNLANGWVDEVSGPKTWLRYLGASGDNLADMVKELRARGIDYSPYADWTIGEGNSARQLYRASLMSPAEAEGSMPEDAYNFGDYNPEYEEDVDTFVPVDENGNPIKEPEKDDYEIVPDLKDERPRYAGVFGPAIGLGMQLAGIGRPDTSGLEAAANKASGPVAFAKWMPRGDFAVYKPDDPWFYTSPIMAQSNATQRSIANKSAVTKGAETLANNYATMIALGNAQRQQADNNYNKYMKAKEYNGNIYESNARRFDANSQFNAEAFNRNKQYAAQLNMQAAQAKMAADADWYNGIYGNVAGIFKGIGDIGRENAQHNMIARMAADGIFGTLDDQHIGHGYLKRVPKTGIAAKGGKLNKKRGGK